MKTFLLKRTVDGTCHLYLDDPNLEGFLKVTQAQEIEILRKEIEFFKNFKYAVAYDEDAYHKTLFGIMDNEVFKVELPKASEIKFIDDICIFERSGQWSTMVYKHGFWHEQLLGDKHSAFLSCPENIKYKQLYWIYFTKTVDCGYELTHFIDRKPIIFGPYAEIHHNGNAKIVALHKDGYYDVFNPNSLEPLKGETNDAFEALKGVFVWNDARKKWSFHEDCRLFGKNAVFQALGDNYGEKIKLFRIDDGEIKLVDTGRWHWGQGKNFGLCIEGVYYLHDPHTGLVDLDNPKLTLKKRIKDFFKKKSTI